MKLLFCFLLAALVPAADRHAAINGVWRAQIDGVPALVMTVTDEGGDLRGAILFYMVRRDAGQPVRSAPGHPEPLLRLSFDGKALEFSVSHRRSHGARTAHDPPVVFRLKLTGSHQGTLVRMPGEEDPLPVTRDH